MTVDAVLIDTTVAIDVLRGRRRPTDRLKEFARRGVSAYISAISIEEIARGVRSHEVERALRLFDGLEVVPLGRDAAWVSGIWRRDLAQNGIIIPQGDCLIAATAHAAGARLATGNPRHFPMPDLVVEHWPVGV